MSLREHMRLRSRDCRERPALLGRPSPLPAAMPRFSTPRFRQVNYTGNITLDDITIRADPTRHLLIVMGQLLDINNEDTDQEFVSGTIDVQLATNQSDQALSVDTLTDPIEYCPDGSCWRSGVISSSSSGTLFAGNDVDTGGQLDVNVTLSDAMSYIGNLVPDVSVLTPRTASIPFARGWPFGCGWANRLELNWQTHGLLPCLKYELSYPRLHNAVVWVIESCWQGPSGQ